DAGDDVVVASDIRKVARRAGPNRQDSVIGAADCVGGYAAVAAGAELVPDRLSGRVGAPWGTCGHGVSHFGGCGEAVHRVGEASAGYGGGVGEVVVAWRQRVDYEVEPIRRPTAWRGVHHGHRVDAAEGQQGLWDSSGHLRRADNSGRRQRAAIPIHFRATYEVRAVHGEGSVTRPCGRGARIERSIDGRRWTSGANDQRVGWVCL